MKNAKVGLSNTAPSDAQQLYEAAEAFYYAGILTSLYFDAKNIHANYYTSATEAAVAALAGQNKINSLGAPPIVTFSFAIELYIKLLRFLADTTRMRGHNLHHLFSTLYAAAPKIGSTVIQNHHYARGNRREFFEYIRREAMSFENWRYSHEKDNLSSSADALFVLANAFRDTVRELHPDLYSAFHNTHARLTVARGRRKQRTRAAPSSLLETPRSER